MIIRPCVLALVLVLPPVTAQQPTPAPEAKPAPAATAPAATAAAAKESAIRFDATTMVIPAGKHDMRALVDATAQFLKRNIDRRELDLGERTSIELQTPMSLDANGCEEAVCHLLFSRGFVLVPHDTSKGLYEVINLGGPRAREAFASAPQRTTEAILARPHLQQPVTTVVTLRRINATIAMNSLRPFFAQVGGGAGGGGLTVGSGGGNDTLLLSGIQSQVADAIVMLRKIDEPEGAGEQPAPAEVGDERVGGATAARVQALEQTIKLLTERIAALEKQLAVKK